MKLTDSVSILLISMVIFIIDSIVEGLILHHPAGLIAQISIMCVMIFGTVAFYDWLNEE